MGGHGAGKRGLYMDQGPGVSTVWYTWRMVRKVAQHEPRLHAGEEQEVNVKVTLAFNPWLWGKRGKGKRE